MNNNIIDDDCSICCEKIEQQNYALLDCNHYFHTVCIEKWINENKKRSCPMCRNTVEFMTIKNEHEIKKINVEENVPENMFFNIDSISAQIMGMDENEIEKSIESASDQISKILGISDDTENNIIGNVCRDVIDALKNPVSNNIFDIVIMVANKNKNYAKKEDFDNISKKFHNFMNFDNILLSNKNLDLD
jgi:hypothetical protein